MKFRPFAAVLSILVLISIPGGGAGRSASSRAPLETSDDLKPMLKLKLWDLNGQKFDINKLKGSVVILDFWATWCGPCIAEIPRLNQLEQQYGASKVKVIGVTLASGTAAEVKPFLTRHNVKYKVVMGDDTQGYELNIMGYPTTYLLTKDWKVFQKYVGAGSLKIQRIESDIKKLLEMETRSAP